MPKEDYYFVAARKLYPNVVKVHAGPETVVCFGSDNKKITVDEESIKEEATKRFEATAYAANRFTEYPTWREQMDDLFHNGAFSEDMTKRIQAVKGKHPK